jgi:hypothetical protein
MIRFIDNSFDSGNNYGGGFNQFDGGGGGFGNGGGRGFNDFGGFGGFNFPNFGGGGGGGGAFNPSPIVPVRPNPTPGGLPSFTNGAIGSGVSTGALISPPRTEPVIIQPTPTPANPIPAPVLVEVPVRTPPADPTPTPIQTQIDAAASTLANDIVKQLVDQGNPTVGGRIFTRFEPINDIVENQKVFLTTGLFSNTTNGVSLNQATMSVLFTGSIQSEASKQYYYETWNKNPATSADAEPQFSIAYGHQRGSGSSAAGTLNDSPSRAVYSQYRLLLLNPEDTQFTFKDGTSTDSIYAINFNRARILEKVDPGNWQLTLAQLSGSTIPNASHTGSNVRINTPTPNFITLIDDSGDVNNTGTLGTGNVYNIVSGSLTNGIWNPAAPRYYGLMYPALGVVILNDTILNASASFNTVSGSNVAGDNAWKLFTSISGAMTSSVNYAMQARNIETITSTHFFVRVKNGEYNFSNNPTFITGSVGEFSQPTFIGDPKTYLTTIGMYNDRQELLAVAKLSQPIQKSFSIETLIKVKLDF